MTSHFVLRADDDGIATLTLNRPDNLNALNAQVFETLRVHLDAIRDAGESIGCVILKGAGRSFCAGADRDMLTGPRDSKAIAFRADTISALASMPQPVIAAVHGHCYAGGLELAVAADFIIAAESAKFVDLHAKLGGTPRWGLSVRLPRRIGIQAAKEMMFTGRAVDGIGAVNMGLALRCVPDMELETAAVSLARAILNNSRQAVTGCKHLVDHQVDESLTDALNYEAMFK